MCPLYRSVPSPVTGSPRMGAILFRVWPHFVGSPCIHCSWYLASVLVGGRHTTVYRRVGYFFYFVPHVPSTHGKLSCEEQHSCTRTHVLPKRDNSGMGHLAITPHSPGLVSLYSYEQGGRLAPDRIIVGVTRTCCPCILPFSRMEPHGGRPSRIPSASKNASVFRLPRCVYREPVSQTDNASGGPLEHGPIQEPMPGCASLTDPMLACCLTGVIASVAFNGSPASRQGTRRPFLLIRKSGCPCQCECCNARPCLNMETLST